MTLAPVNLSRTSRGGKLLHDRTQHAETRQTIRMKTGALLARLAAVAILLFAFGLSVYRAKVQTIAHDEALTYIWFLDQGVAHVLFYNPANHVLQTLMAKPIVKALGISEFTLRIPTLIGSALYLIAVYLLCRRLFGEGLLFVLAAAMLALNPSIRDFMAAARGYSLGLAGLVVAMYWFARLAERGQFDGGDGEWRRGCMIASISLALSVAANFTNVVPAVCLTIAFVSAALGGMLAMVRVRDPRLRAFAKYFVFPGAATGFCLLWPYLIQARLAQFVIHLDSASIALREIFNSSFLYPWVDDLLDGLGAVAPSAGSWQVRVMNLGEYFLMPLLFLLVLAGVALARRAKQGERAGQKAQCRIFGGAAVGSVVLTVALHFLTNVNYPNTRYGLFLIPLFTVGAVLAARELSAQFPSRLLRGAGLLISASIFFVYAQSLNAVTFRYSKYDSISRDLYNAIERDAQARGLTSARVGGTWWYQPEIDFYRLRFHATWMQEYEIKDRSYWWQTPGAGEPADYDYFVFTPANDPHLTGPRVRTLFHDDKTQATIIAISHD